MKLCADVSLVSKINCSIHKKQNRGDEGVNPDSIAGNKKPEIALRAKHNKKTQQSICAEKCKSVDENIDG